MGKPPYYNFGFSECCTLNVPRGINIQIWSGVCFKVIWYKNDNWGNQLICPMTCKLIVLPNMHCKIPVNMFHISTHNPIIKYMILKSLSNEIIYLIL